MVGQLTRAVSQRDHGDLERNRQAFLAPVNRSEVLHVGQSLLDGEAQGTGVRAVQTPSRVATPAPEGVTRAVAEQAPGPIVDEHDAPVGAQHDDRVGEVLEQVRPRSSENLTQLVFHTPDNTLTGRAIPKARLRPPV